MRQAAPNVEEIFFAALEQEGLAARAAFLDRACGDPELRRRVERLLVHDAQAVEFLEVPAASPTSGLLPDGRPVVEEPGAVIGPYKLLEVVGEGGMGTVYMAEQREPVRRRVALKVIKPGMDTRQVIARFEAERQALALMDHPNIARVLDAGATGSGRPYFVMELVRGIPITDYCDRERLSIPGRLGLFVLVCRAVQHAHQKGVIHRDLKPSNILVTIIDGVAMPKVIDFGVAKATGGALTERTLYTGFHQLVGTPLYMSPEQAELSGVDADTRSDIYALGVLLYELLTGTTPIDAETFRKAAFDELRRLVREEEPPTPSTRLATLNAERRSSISTARLADPRHLGRALRGELDWIVMKALEKDRRRRYETANAFAADVLRHLSDEPVEACPPTAGYRLRKFARRNRMALATAGIVALALVTGTAVSIWQADLARHAAMRAERSEADTQAFSDFLVDDVLAAARPRGMQGGLGVGVTVVEALEMADAKLGERFAGRPLAEATACDAIGRTWRDLMRYGRAERLLRRAVELRSKELGTDEPLTLESRSSLATVVALRSRRPEAIGMQEEILRKRLARLGPDHEATLISMNNLAALYLEDGYPSKALSLYAKAAEIGRRVHGEAKIETLNATDGLANVYLVQGQYSKALPLLVRCLEISRRVQGADHPDTLASMRNLAALYGAQNEDKQAHALLAEALEVGRRVHGVENPGTLDAMSSLAAHYRDHGEYSRAEPLFAEVLEVRRHVAGDDHGGTLAAMNNLAALYWSMKRLDLSIPLFEEALERARATLGPEDLGTLQAMANLGVNYRDAGRRPKGTVLLEQAWELARKRSDRELEYIAWIPQALAQAYDQDGLFEKSEAIHRAALEDASETAGDAVSRPAAELYMLSRNLLNQRKYAEAEPLLRQCLDVVERTEPDEWTTFHTRSLLGGSLLGQKDYAGAEPLLLSGYEGMKRRQQQIRPAERARLAEAVGRLVQLYDELGQRAKADEWRSKLTEVESTNPPENRKH